MYISIPRPWGATLSSNDRRVSPITDTIPTRCHPDPEQNEGEGFLHSRPKEPVAKDSSRDTPSAVPQAWQSDNRQHPPITSQPPTRCHPERRLRFASQNGIERRIYAFPLNGASGGGFVSGYAFRRTVNISDHGSAPIGCDRHATYDPDAVGDYAASARITNWIGSCGMAEAIP